MYGLWKLIRVDHGREFYLLLYVQEALRCRVGPRDILPYVQSPSTEVRVLILLTSRVYDREESIERRHTVDQSMRRVT